MWKSRIRQAATVARRLNLLRTISVAVAMVVCGGAQAGTFFEDKDAIPHAVDMIRGAIGGHIRALSISMSPDDIAIRAQDPKDHRHVDEWHVKRSHLGTLQWDRLSGPAPATLQLLDPDLEDNLFDLDAVDFGAADTLMRAAVVRAALEDEARVVQMEIARQIYILPKPSTGDVKWTLDVHSDRESAQIFADARGQITGVDLAETNRAKTLDLFKQPEFVAEAAKAFRATVSAGGVLTAVNISSDSVGFATNLPDTSLAIITTGSLKSLAAYSWSLNGLKRVMGNVDFNSFLPAPDAPFSVDEVDWTLLGKLEGVAKERLAMPQGSIHDVTVSKPTAGVRATKVIWKISVSDPDGEQGSIETDVKGNVEQVTLPEGRAAAVDWRNPAPMLEAFTRIDHEFGPGAQFSELSVENDRVTIVARDPQKPGEFVQIFLGKDGFQRFGAASMFSVQRPPFTLADLRGLSTEKLRALETQTTTTLKLPPTSITSVTFGRGGMDPSPHGNVTIEIRAEEHPFGRGGRIEFEFDGTVIATYLPDPEPAAAPSGPSQSDYADCDQQADPDRGIAGCTKIIAHPGETIQDQAVTYTNRGLDYMAKRDFTRAIADQTAALKLNPKYVNAYNNRGLAYQTEGDLDHAIADYDQAIRLVPNSFIILGNRGRAYFSKGEADRAIADFEQALRANPQFAVGYFGRGRVYLSKNDNTRAIADFGQALQLEPKYVNAYYQRGRAFLYAGSIAKAQADLKQALELSPKYAYSALWLDLVERRNQLPSRLAELTAQVDAKAWPAPIIQFLLGKMKPDELLAAAKNPDPATQRDQLCEANFYSGEMTLLKGKKYEAKRLFETAVGLCPHNFDEWDGAKAELKTLAGR